MFILDCSFSYNDTFGAISKPGSTGRLFLATFDDRVMCYAGIYIIVSRIGMRHSRSVQVNRQRIQIALAK